MQCESCGGEQEVKLIETVAVLQCRDCGKGEFIPQSTLLEVSQYRARVDNLLMTGQGSHGRA